jgi:hypothetical protein
VTDPTQSDDQPHQQARWTQHFDEIDREIAQLASICKVQMLRPGVIGRCGDRLGGPAA